MRRFLVRTALSLIWLAAGRLGRKLGDWIDEAEGQGLDGRQAFERVWRKAKAHHRNTSDWLLGLLIEAQLGRQLAGQGRLAGKLSWPVSILRDGS